MRKVNTARAYFLQAHSSSCISLDTWEYLHHPLAPSKRTNLIMDDSDDFEIDPAMAEAMGFTKFGGQKRKYRDDAIVDSPSNANFTPKKATGSAIPDHSKPVSAVTVTPSRGEKAAVHIDGANSAGAANTATASGVDGEDEQSLHALRQGVRNANGDMVYFLPSFLEDPWRRLKPT